ncbi:MAG: tyrosine--tRNA ligase [Eubacteriaceae bacterium]|nr:tyrosine--tRNA ligase [Eubacteriaceae bacterium]
MENIFDVLSSRGYIEQCTHTDEIRELFAKPGVVFYIGFDATADSLHIGHFIQIMVMKHLQEAGHVPLVLLGGGTTMVGDPSGKTDMRQMMGKEDIQANADKFEAMFGKYIDFSDGRALIDNNVNWLAKLNYIEFLRDVGPHFSVNRMLAAECYKNRMETGLTFLEFNYMIMQAYDFLVLHEKYGCMLQIGGNDQWSNIIAGVDLIRRKLQEPSYGMTLSLLANSEGIKMGKTEKGALWLDEAKTSPYEFFQYWRNIDDADVGKCLGLLTFLPMDEVGRLASLEGELLNEAKETLAFEVTKLIHGEEKAKSALEASKALFSGDPDAISAPSVAISNDAVSGGINVVDMLVLAGCAPSKSEARRLIAQGGIALNGERVDDVDYVVEIGRFAEGFLLVKKGKKSFTRIVLE